MLREINQIQKKKYYMISLTIEIETSQTCRTREQNGGCQELVGGGTQMLVKGYKLSGVRETNSEDLVYNLVATVNNAKLYTSNLLKE